MDIPKVAADEHVNLNERRAARLRRRTAVKNVQRLIADIRAADPETVAALRAALGMQP